MRLVIPLDDLLHLEVVFLGLGEGVFEDGKSFFLDLVVDGGEIGYHSETLGMLAMGCFKGEFGVITIGAVPPSCRRNPETCELLLVIWA